MHTWMGANTTAQVPADLLDQLIESVGPGTAYISI